MNVKQILEALSIPTILYHATYKPLLSSIKKYGLDSRYGKKTYPDSKNGVVYLAISKDIAESYAEVSDEVSEEWLDQIVILKIKTKGLDYSKFKIDSNVINSEGETIEYHGSIPYNNISLEKK